MYICPFFFLFFSCLFYENDPLSRALLVCFLNTQMKEKPAGCSNRMSWDKGLPRYPFFATSVFSRHLMGGLTFQMHEALLWRKKGSQWQISGKHSVKSCNFPADLPAAGTPGFPGRLPDWSKELPLRRCPSGSGRSSTQTHGNTRKHTKRRKHGNSGTGTQRSRSPRTRAAPARGLEPPHLVMKNHLVRRKGEKKTSKRGTKNNLVMKNHLMRRKGELTSRRGT